MYEKSILATNMLGATLKTMVQIRTYAWNIFKWNFSKGRKYNYFMFKQSINYARCM